MELYRAFTLEEKETLKTYDRLQHQVGEVLSTTYKKLPQDNMLEGIKYLKERRLTLKEKTSLDPIYIGLVGRTGAGKSSLLNALIDHQFFLPVSGRETCTSCMVEVSSSRGENYEAKIHLLSLQEWKEELKNLVELVKKPEDQEQEEEEEENGEEETDVGEAVQKLRALYGRDAETRPYGELLRAKLPINIPPSKCIILKAAQAEELSRRLEPYIRCHNDLDEEHPAQDEERTKTRIWPLIKYAEVTIPKSKVIPEGVVFVDIPGTGDYNKERDEMWKEGINKCSVIWVISDIERIVGDKVHAVLLAESIKAFPGGTCSDISLVVNKIDNLELDEYLRERKGKQTPIETKSDAILEQKEDVKRKKRRSMQETLQKRLPSDSEVLQKPDLVYTVSTREYWRAHYLTKEETEIPKLRQYVRNIYLKEKKKILTAYMTEARGIVLLAKHFTSMQDTVHHYEQSNLETFVDEKIKDLKKDIEKCFAQLEEPLTKGVEDAKSSYQGTFFKLLTPDTNYRGFHKTLKALCQKNGVYASPTFARMDLNSAFAQPIYDNIDHIFTQIFRTKMGTRSSLKGCLDMFRDAVQKKIQEVEEMIPVTNDNKKLNFLVQEINTILSTLEKGISKQRMAIYQSLPLSIESKLQIYYKEAAKIQGKDSCQKMKNLLKENIERKTREGMFEWAKEKMTTLLSELKNEIVTNLQRDISTMLKLALSHREDCTERLPDLQDECKEIDRIYNDLKRM